tara:strand:- start:619 stop:888 length:270 start_codon:yes stop_codon:yes gene_type:complete
MSEIEEEGWCHYSGMPSPNAYDKTNETSEAGWVSELNNHIYHLQDRDDSFKKGDLFFERAGRLGPIEWDGEEQLNYHCKKIISIKPKQR